MNKLDAIRSFVEVANAGSFTQAAEKLGINRIKITRHIKEIEEWLNQRLLHRTTRSVSLTPPGQDALIRCERILNEVAGLESQARSHNEELVGTIRIATPIGLGQHLLFDLVETFTQKNPKVIIQLLLSDKNAQLVDERVDVALRYTNQPDENLIARRLMTLDSAVCCSPTYLNKCKEPTHPEQLIHHNCLVHLDQSWQFLDQQQALNIKVSGAINANDVGVILKATLNGLGIALLPCDLANKHLESGALIQILKDTPIPTSALWAVYLSRSYQRPVVRAFIDFVADAWSEDIKVASPTNPTVE